MKAHISILFALLFCSIFANAQNYEISQEGSYTTCSTRMFDSDSVGFYANDENYTITFCSDGTGGGNTINIGFGELFSVDPSDTLFIYDGSSTTSPLIGAYNNDNPPVGVTSTTANPTGCVTFKFVSDAAVVDTGWIAILNCVKVCQPIDPVITTTPALTTYGPDSNYTNICAGDTVFFTASGNYPHNGINAINYPQSDATSTYEWNFGEGTESTNQTGSIVYDNEGGYAILLTITDANGCQEQKIHKVRTGITPIFSGIYATPDTMCFGDTVNLVGGFNQTTGNISGVSPNSGAITAGGTVTGQTFLPDGSGNSYTTSVGITGFPNQTITAATDIQEICMNMEHSYNGDLDITLECPNGQSIVLFDGSGGAVMGEPVATDLPVDDNSSDITPGIGYNYCYNPVTTNGLPTDNIIPLSTYTDILGNTSTDIEQIPGGDYQPEESFDGLIGCPIDGDWTITVTDNLSADNGYIFEWGVTLNPNINPNAEYYDVQIVDGVWQTSPDFVSNYDTLIFVAPSTEGDNNYTFEVTDEYGCDFDTTVIVNVLPEIIAIATPDTNLCAGQEVNLNVGGFSSATDNFTIEMEDSWGDGWNGQSIDIYEDGVLIGNYTIDDGDAATDFFTMTPGNNIVIVYNDGSFQSEASFEITDSNGNTIVLFEEGDMTGLSQGDTIYTDNIGYVFNWGPATFLSDPTIPDPLFNGTSTTTYAVEMYLSEHPECSVISDSITIAVNSNDLPTITGDSVVCFGEAVTYTVSGADTVTWSNNSNDSTITFIPQNDSLLTVTASTLCGNITWNKHIVVYPEIDITVSPDTIICEGDAIPLALEGILDECTYLLTLTDLNGNGWDATEGVTIKINGVIYESSFSVDGCSDTICTNSLVIPVNDGDVISLEYSSGPTDAENIVQLFNASNTELLNVTGPALGVIGTYTASCSNAYDISWSPSTQLNDATITNPIFTASTPASYEATVLLNSNNNCSGTSNTINIDVRSVEIPQITGDSTICIGETINLNINADSVLWWGDSTQVNTSVSFAPEQDSIVIATASTFCVKNWVDTHTVIVNPLPTITIINDTTITIQDNVTITTSGGTSYSWFPSEYLDCDTCDSPVASPVETGTYQVTVTDSNGCVSTDYVNIEVLIPDLFIPNGFSPNGDGLNDVVLVRSLSIHAMEFYIFDRWGNLVFETGKQNIGWDGTHNGKKLDTGVYVYKFEAEMVTGEFVEKSGTITLFR